MWESQRHRPWGWASEKGAWNDTPERGCQGSCQQHSQKASAPGWPQDSTPFSHPQANRKLLQEHTRHARHALASKWVPQAPAPPPSSWFQLQFPHSTSDMGMKSRAELQLAAWGLPGSAAQQGTPGGGWSGTSHIHQPEKVLLPWGKCPRRLTAGGGEFNLHSGLFLEDPKLKHEPSSGLAKPPQKQYAPMTNSTEDKLANKMHGKVLSITHLHHSPPSLTPPSLASRETQNHQTT